MEVKEFALLRNRLMKQRKADTSSECAGGLTFCSPDLADDSFLGAGEAATPCAWQGCYQQLNSNPGYGHVPMNVVHTLLVFLGVKLFHTWLSHFSHVKRGLIGYRKSL